MKTKKILAVSSLVLFGLLYQNCSTQSRKMYREVRIDSDVKIEIADQKGNSFLAWNFYPGNETSVEITNNGNSFCKRGFVLNTPAEKEWFYALSKLNSRRNTASSSSTKSLKVLYKGKNLLLSDTESLHFFDLMENTKKNHDVKIIECDGQKKWSFKKVKAETLTQTNANSKIVQTFLIKLVKDKVELSLDEQPIKIAKNQDEAFCNYTGMTYSPSSKLLTAMFSLDEANKNSNLSGSRGLAAAPENVLMIEIDDRTKFSVDAESALGLSVKAVIEQMKTAKAARKTCGYTY